MRFFTCVCLAAIIAVILSVIPRGKSAAPQQAPPPLQAPPVGTDVADAFKRSEDARKNGEISEIKWVCPGPCGADCRCDRNSDCEAKKCQTAARPYPVPKDGMASDAYADAVKRVEAGEVVYLCVGVPVEQGFARVESLAGFTPGVYRCRLINGRPQMERGHMVSVKDNPFCQRSCTYHQEWAAY